MNVSREEIRSELDFFQSSVLATCANCCNGLIAIFAILSVRYWVVSPLSVSLPLCLQKWVSILIFGLLSYAVSSKKVSFRQAHWVTRIMLFNIIGSVCFTSWMLPQEGASIYLMTLVVGVGLILLSLQEAVLSWILIWAGWLACAHLAPEPERAQSLMMLTLFTAIALLSLEIRVRVYRSLFRLHQKDQEKNLRLSQNLVASEQARDELDRRVNERTQELIRANEELRRTNQERSVLQEQLWQSQKMDSLGRLAGGVAHDFNNLLTVILTNLELAQGHKLEPELREHLEDAQVASQRCAELTSNLLAFSRKQVMQRRRLDLVSVLRDTQRLIRPLLGEDIALEYRFLVESPALIMGDAGQLQQVLLNLVVNARDAMPSGGSLSLTLEGTASGYAIHVTDSGCGMPPEVVQRALEPFYTTKPVGSGTGLGLSTVDGIVAQLNGKVEIQSRPGKGTRVTIHLPAVGPSEMESGVRTLPEVAIRKGKGERILLVEDEAQLRNLALFSLKRSGYQVSAAENGEAALALLQKGSDAPQLLVTDVIMPGMDGPTLAKKVHQMYGRVPVLYMSGYTSDRLTPLGLDEQEYNFLPKPYTISDLCRKIQQVLETREEQNRLPCSPNG